MRCLTFICSKVTHFVLVIFNIFILHEFVQILYSELTIIQQNYKTSHSYSAAEPDGMVSPRDCSLSHVEPGQWLAQSEHSGNWTDNWQLVDPNLLIYSAYLDARTVSNPIIRIIARMTQFYWPTKRPAELDLFRCLIKFDPVCQECPEMIHVKPRWRKMFEGDWMELSLEFLCDLNKTYELPKKVAIVGNVTTGEPLWIRIHHLNRPLSRPNSIAVCVKPIYSSCNQSNLAEFIAYYKVLGVHYFNFYDATSSPATSQFLQRVSQNDPSVIVFPWNARKKGWPTFPEKFRSWWAALQDCVYRSMFQVEFILVIDSDQFLVPRNSTSLLQLLIEVQQAAGTYLEEFIFSQAVFCVNFPSSIQHSTLPPYRVFQKTTRYYVPEGYWGSKYVVRPEIVEETGGYRADKMIRKVSYKYVEEKLGIIHHYRGSMEPLYNICSNYTRVKNTPYVSEDNSLPRRFGELMLPELRKLEMFY
ncbi:uncharacterized protein LOC143229698 [Tachypleus tridentatus]|uniref:uncharacterized protein LOC143229698 n=1 Tax=Tachypleus tridentatus TaxID=6853 RepID=UPI003FD1A36B